MDGVVIPIDKPRQWSSFQAVNKVKAAIRNRYGIKKFKIGHAGTLDPLATGLLLVCVGKATKQIEQLQTGTKEYSGTIVLGAETPCYDLERPISRYAVPHGLTRQQVIEAAQQFVGDIEQVPPLFSAVKVDGQRAYKYARTDQPDAVVEKRSVKVYAFDITNFRPGDDGFVPPPIVDTATLPQTGLYNAPQGVVPEGLPQADFHISCGKGTYVRSLARDLGLALGTAAFLATLRRERVGDYTISNAVPLDKVADFDF